MAIDEINAKGGVLGRKLEMVVADETENPETGISAIKKLTADEKVDVLIGGYTSGVTLAQLPHISAAKTIYLGVGAASPRSTPRSRPTTTTTSTSSASARSTPAHQARQLTGFISAFVKGELGLGKIAIVGENAKWVQDLVPLLKKGATEAGADVRTVEFFDTATSDFSPLFSKVKDSGAQYMVVILSHASSDIFAKQWYDARFPMPYRRHRRQEHGRRLLRARSAARRSARLAAQLRGARAADAEDHAVLRRVHEAHATARRSTPRSAPTTRSTSMPRRSSAPGSTETDAVIKELEKTELRRHRRQRSSSTRRTTSSRARGLQGTGAAVRAVAATSASATWSCRRKPRTGEFVYAALDEQVTFSSHGATGRIRSPVARRRRRQAPRATASGGMLEILISAR